MDGIHDLGGKEGFGPVDRRHEDEAFHEAWEGRVLGIVRGMARPTDWSIDWFRHCRELIEPVDYLTRPYYDQWLQSYAAMLINSGIATVEELASGRSSALPTAALSKTVTPEELPAAIAAVPRFDQHEGPPPQFQVGDRVRTEKHGVSTHTRLPAYLRGAVGEVSHFRGHHVFPDANALGEKRAEPLYTVAFAAADLWPEAAGSRDRIHADLWESYLHRP